MQNTVPRHQLGISIGTMNFSRNLYATILIAVFGAIVARAGAARRRPARAGPMPSAAFLRGGGEPGGRVVALVLMEQKPLQTGAEMAAQ